MSLYDDVIIGAGHNGLVCATYLAKKGRRVLVLEASDEVGGLAAQYEFHPGYKTSIAQTLSHFSEDISKELRLEQHGYKSNSEPLNTASIREDGKVVQLQGDSLYGATRKDTEQYAKYISQLKKFAKVLSPFWMKTIPRIGKGGFKYNLVFAMLGLKLRLLGKKDMGEFMRIATLPTRDLMDENFDDEQLKVLLSWDALIGSRMAPRSPNGSVMNLLYKMSGKHEGNHFLPESGGMASLISALKSAAEAAGVEIKTSSPVERIGLTSTESGVSATSVSLSNGESIDATNVVSAIDPKRTFLNLIGAQNLDIEFTNRINRLRTDGLVAKLNIALSDLPDFKGLTSLEGRLILAPAQDSLEFAYDNAKYGEIPENPVMEVTFPSLRDDSICPKGKHILSANVMYVPHTLKGGWTDDNKNQLYWRCVEVLERYAPNIRPQIEFGELLTPADIEQKFNVTGGHWHHGELSLWQMLMMRPTYEAAQYKTPISGLYLCSAGSHPGGGVVGAAGHNAAKEILKVAK